MSDSEPQPEIVPTDAINLRVVSQVHFCIGSFTNLFKKDGNEIFFKIKKTTPLGKLTSAYLSRQDLDPASIRFLFDGNRIGSGQTPEEL